jgi:hypothetical protein
MDTTRVAAGAVLVVVGVAALFYGATALDNLPGLVLGASALAIAVGTLLFGTSGTPEEDATRQV